MTVTRLLLATLLVAPLVAEDQLRSDFTSDNRWIISNGIIEATFAYTDRNTFEFTSLRHTRHGDQWQAAQQLVSSPIRFASATTAVDGYIPLRLVSHSTQRLPKGLRQNIVFDELDGGFRITLSLEIYPEHPVLRYATRIRNLQDAPRRLRMADMLSWNFQETATQFRMLRVNQWSVLPPNRNFEPKESLLATDGTREYVHSGAGAPECSWMALRDKQDRGLFAGWEFDGKTEAFARYLGQDRRLQLAAYVDGLNRELQPDMEFQTPWAFVGLFHGDWDEAGYRTQRFVDSVLAKPLPADITFPYVVWDSWGYRTDIDEQILRRNAEQAAKLGAELFIVDLGWARAIGDWRENPDKFPSGLRALSDYVHSLGMKFGLHVAPAEADDASPVVRANPDWLSTEIYSYFGAKSLCLSHKPAQEWVVQEVVRMIDEYNVDWILQDGEHIVKRCTRTNHTHDPEDSNYANAVEGLNAVLDAVQKQRPKTLWENCANGGSMMTFNMVKYYVTSITNDASGALASRQAVYGATYPFPPRYTDRYMPENPTDTYTTRSYMFGGPWIFMNKLADLTPAEQALAASEIRLYKDLRRQVAGSKVYHLTPMPDAGRVDALAAHNPTTDRMAVVVTRDDSPDRVFVLKPQGLTPGKTYRVSYQDDRRVYTMSAEQLMASGVPVLFETARASEIVYLEPLDH